MKKYFDWIYDIDSYDVKKWVILSILGILFTLFISFFLYFQMLDFKCNQKAKAIAYVGTYSWWLDECVFIKGNERFLLKQIRRIQVDSEEEEAIE